MIHYDVDRWETWQRAALDFFEQGVSPTSIEWRSVAGAAPFFGLARARDRASATGALGQLAEPLWSAVVPLQPAIQELLERMELAAAHRDPARWALFYRLLWRVGRGETRLLSQRSDADVRRLTRLRRDVLQATREMEASVELRSGLPGAGDFALSWYAPRHAVARLAAMHFVRAMPLGKWALLTPDETVEWDGRLLRFGAGVPCSMAPRSEQLVALWRERHEQLFRPEQRTMAAAGGAPLTHAPTGGKRGLLLVTASDPAPGVSADAARILATALAELGIQLDGEELLDLADASACQGVPRRVRRQWLADQLTLRQPQQLVVLGASAAQLLWGSDFRVSQRHGQVFASDWAPWTLVTYHPAALVHVPDSSVRARMHEQFLYDLHRLAEELQPAVGRQR